MQTDSSLAVRQNEIREARKLFFAGKPVTGLDVPSYILNGWMLSKKYKVDRTVNCSPPVLTAKELAELKEEYRILLAAAEPMLNMLEVSIRDTGYIATLAVKSGHLLAVVGDNELMDQARSQFNIPGAERSIKAVGISALTLSIMEKRPITVTGYEHYNEHFNNWRCTAAPIFDSEDEPVASLSLSSEISRRDIHTMTLAQSCAEAITLRMREVSLMEKQKHLMAMIESVHDALPEMILATDKDGVITHANDKAASYFSCMTMLIGLPISNIIGKPDMPRVQRLYKTMESATLDLEVIGCNGPSNHICRFVPIVPCRGVLSGMIITISSKRHVIDFAKHVSGNYAKYCFDDIKGESSVLKEQIALAKKAASSNYRILLTGESGTGKELFAQSIHNSSSVSQGPFVAISCAAIPRDLIESELFGYVGGAFTGARRNGMIGKMELATGGTLFLDEINSLPLEMQAKLLRVLQQMEIVRIGDTKPTPINARIISATNKNLHDVVKSGQFREDLYFRLNVVEVTIPPLRDRAEDISLLAHTFLRRQSYETGRHFLQISAGALDLLYAYSWPGNIRELDNVCERALLLSENGVIEARHLPSHIAATEQEQTAPSVLGGSVQAAYKELVVETLRQYNGNISKAAAHLGIARTTLYRKMRAFGLA